MFARVLKPSDISESLLEALNFDILPPCSADELLPPAPDHTSYLPPLSPKQAINAASYSDAIKIDPAIARNRKDFDDRLAELRIENDAAFRVITKSFKAKDGEKPPRLAHMRKFWEGLEHMSQYWDCSLDQYFEVPDSPPFAEAEKNGESQDWEKCAKRARLESLSESNDHILETGVKAIEDQEIMEDVGNHDDGDFTPSDNDFNDLQSVNGNRVERSPTPCPQPRMRMRYKGRRTSTGRMLPDSFRSQTMHAFLEGIVWPFGCSVQSPRRMPLLHIQKLNLPVRQTAMVYRMPKDRQRARAGWLEGPVIGLQVRSETDFLDDDGQPLEAKARLDLMREIGGLLQLAQERRRGGQTEVKPGEGKWWTTKPRWGGGPGGEVGNEESGNADIVAAVEELTEASKSERRGGGIRERKRKTPAMLWKELKCGSGYWDPKTEYAAIGREPGSDYDEVFMLSSLNHHISALKLTIHRDYLEYLTTGTLPKSLPGDATWCKPSLRRTVWFDLFSSEQRAQAFRVIWAITSFLMRNGNTQV